MNEIEKMYENCGIKPELHTFPGRDWDDEGLASWYEEKIYPPFTAEKQLELIKLLAGRVLKIKTQKQPCATYIGILGQYECFYGIEETHFKQALAGVINYLWQDLTPEEKEQIRSVLNV